MGKCVKSFKRNFSDAEARVAGYPPLDPQLLGSGTLGLMVIAWLAVPSLL